MPTTQKSQQKQTKATQKVGGSAKKPVTKAMEGGKSKVAAVKSKATTRGGSAKGGVNVNKYKGGKGGSVKTSTAKPPKNIGGGASKSVRRGLLSIKKGGSDEECYEVASIENNKYTVKPCESSSTGTELSVVEKKERKQLLGKIEEILLALGRPKANVKESIEWHNDNFTIEQLKDMLKVKKGELEIKLSNKRS
jgi:hypothetical protein